MEYQRRWWLRSEGGRRSRRMNSSRGGLCLRGLSGGLGLGVVRGGAAAGDPPPPCGGRRSGTGLAAERVCGGEERLVPSASAIESMACFRVREKRVVLGGPPQLGAGGEPPAWCWWPRRDLGSWDWVSGVRRVFMIIPYVRACELSGRERACLHRGGSSSTDGANPTGSVSGFV